MQYLKDEVKNRIIAVAMREFQEKGFLQASMRDISKNAGVALGNVYRYFKSKEDIFNEIVEPAYQCFFGMEIHKPEMCSEVSLFEEIVNHIIKVMKRYKIQVLIMVDKSKGTNYAGFKEELIRLAEKGIKDGLWPELQKRSIEIKDPFIFYVIASTFTEGLFIILRKYNDGEEIRYLIHQLLQLHFKDLDKRFE
jgi:AcrR family transcriptional regulator